MKKHRFRIALIVAFILLAVFSLKPTWDDYRYQSELEKLSGEDSARFYDEHEKDIRYARTHRLKLGLDLKGGMYVTMEVDVLSMLEKMAKNQDKLLREIIAETRKEAETSDEPVLDIFAHQFSKRNLRLSRYYGDIRDDNDKVLAHLKEETDKAVDRAMEIIRNRIDQYGVSETSIQKQGHRRLVLELPGVSNEKDVRQLIQETAQLEFKLLQDPKVVEKVFDNLDKVLLGKNLVDTLTASTDTSLAQDTTLAVSKKDSLAAADSVLETNLSEEEKRAKLKKEHPFLSLFSFDAQTGVAIATESQKQRVQNILRREDVRQAIPPDFQFAWSAKPVQYQEGSYYILYALKKQPELTGDVIVDARAQTDQSAGGFGAAVVTMEMNSEGAREWARITGANVGKQIAIVLDNVVYSAPNVKQKIIGGNSEISGMDNMEEARRLEIVLKAGALPAPVEIIEERTVGPSLGEDSVRAGFLSLTIGVVLILIFMAFYYHFVGLTADIAVLFNILFVIGILAGFGATLTLPGMAGILLTVGMAVDANVLINERIREEYSVGKTLRAAIDSGYSKAFSAIIDSNITTLITGFILYNFGSGPIQGFALTLIIGIVCSLFTAIIVTRVIVETAVETKPAFVSLG
ncbi:MAG: protein translocase subunit SecD [Chlorobi bacterium]|nr:protein translocase subunit SecD [Chlorobiota bacterium]